MTTIAVAGHGVALGRLRSEGGEALAGSDEDALTLATEAAAAALGRAGGAAPADIDTVLLAAQQCSPADSETLLAALRLDVAVPVVRVPDPLEAVAVAADHGGHSLVMASDGATGSAVVLGPSGYATLLPGQLGGGAALVDRTRDTRFDRYAGPSALLRRAGLSKVSAAPLLDVIALIETGTAGAVGSGGPARTTTMGIADIGVVPPGTTLADWQATGRPPTQSEAGWRPGPRPRGATGVDPDGPLLWRERAELLTPLGARCASCGAVNAPICGAVLCRRCGHRKLDVVVLPREGRVVTYCVSTTLPRAFAAPLAMIYARLDDGTQWKALGPGLRNEDLAIGDRVVLVLRRLVVDDGIPVYGLAFRKELP
jgi:uncharacterized OB-fold protein